MREQPELAATERWFTRRGLPMFIEEYDNGRDVWTRAVPALVVLFLLNTVVTIPFVGFEYDADTGDVLGYDAGRAGWGLACAALLLVAYIVWNRAAGRRPLAPPERVGWPVLVVWLLAPAVIALAATRSLSALVVDVVVNAVLLLVVWVLTRYALLALVWWALRRVFAQLGDVYRLATRALPVQLLVLTVLFLNAEMWQAAGTMPASVLWLALAFFLVLALLFLLGQVREEARELDLALDREQVLSACVRSPLAAVAPSLPDLAEPVPLSPRQRINLTGVLLVSRLLQVLVVSVLVWAFFIAFGLVAVSLPVQETWLGGLAPLDPFVVIGDERGLTRALLRVATFIGGFTAFSVTVSGATDTVYREQFVRGISEAVGRSLGVRRAYLARRRECGLSAPEPLRVAAG